MQVHQIDDLTITLNKKGSREFSKVSYPIRYGRFAEISTPHHAFQFNLNGEVKFIQGRNQQWPHPAEWLKRTMANDWVYYSSGGYTGVYDSFGEYYIPCLSYLSNSIFRRDPFEDEEVKFAIHSWQELSERIKGPVSSPISEDLKAFLKLVAKRDEKELESRSRGLHKLIGESLTVLPPDTRHVDYDVIPVIVADGCLYGCGFCRVKSRLDFAPRTKNNILEQIRGLKQFYSRDIENYNAVFLGQHDALGVGAELLEFTAKNAYELFNLEHSNMRGAYLFFFGSVDSLLNSEDMLFDVLNRLPFYTFINIGLESIDQTTLNKLKKPITVEKVVKAFAKMLDINKRYEKIEVTANFVFGSGLPSSHMASFIEFNGNRLDHFYSKGAIYFSPLFIDRTDGQRGLLREFNKIKAQSRLPTFIYLIQRLVA